MNTKVDIRREVRARIKQMSPEQMQSAAERIFSLIEQLDTFSQSECIALFAAMKDEVPTDIALARWRQLGKRIVVPRVEGEIMRFYDYDPARMTTGAFGIEEPIGDVECSPADIDLIIVPARAFTTSGIRLGRGGGFYDKYMSLPSFRAAKVGIAFECQIFNTLPHDSHDILVDKVIFA